MTRANTGYLLLACAAVVVSASCSKDVILAPSSAPDVGARLSVQAVPDSIPRDGSSQAKIVIETLTADGRAARLVVLRIDTLVNGAPVELGTLSSRSVVTGDDGKAQLTYTAPPPLPTVPAADTAVTVRVTASGDTLRADVSRQVDITLLGAGGPRSAGAPVPAFVVAQTAIVARTPATFDASGTTKDGVRCGGACSFAWTFGDNTSGSGETVAHTYDAAGSYVVTLTATHVSGAAASVSRSVAVQASAKPTADFSYSPTTPSTFQDIMFTAEKSAAAAGRQIASYSWDFGSGGAVRTGKDVVKSFDTPGTYVVTLTVTDDAGEKGATEKTLTVSALPGPTAVLSFSPTTPSTTTTVFFDAGASTAPSLATITSYSFNFGDGTGVGPTTSPTQSHVFAATGIYVVRLTVTDSLGRTGTTTVSVPVIAVSPTAVLTFSPQDPKTGTTVFFDATGSSTPSPARISSYTFNYGDGTGDGPGASPTQTHVFGSPATYVVRLTVIDSIGRSATTTVSVIVRP
jgi:PKD repeat protein